MNPVFLLVGDEEFLKEEWLKDARAKVFKENSAHATTDFNLFFANDIDPSDIINAAKTKPFLNDKRLIIIKNIELLKAAGDKEQIINYLKTPAPDTVLVLDADIREKDLPSDKFLSEASRFAQTVSFKKLYDANLSGWMAGRAVSRKKKIEPAACELLKQLKGNNLKAIDEEIEKLSIYLGQRPVITRADVQQLVGRDVESGIYDLLEAISRNDKSRVLSLGGDFNRNDLGGITGLFCWNLRLILRVREYLKAGWTLDKIGNALGLRKFQLDRVTAQARKLKTSWTKKAIAELTEFDLQLKTSALSDPLTGWQMLLVGLVADV